MIAHIRGTVAEKYASALIVDVQGVGYELQVSLGDYDASTLESSVTFFTHHHVREQSNELFGFSSLAAKKLFQLLIGVQGIGPKAALAILSIGATEEVRNAIANADAVYIARATGVGKKTAERVVVDLSDKVGLPVQYTGQTSSPIEQVGNDEALEALMALGYTLADGTKALEKIDISLPTSERIRQALRS